MSWQHEDEVRQLAESRRTLGEKVTDIAFQLSDRKLQAERGAIANLDGYREWRQKALRALRLTQKELTGVNARLRELEDLRHAEVPPRPITLGQMKGVIKRAIQIEQRLAECVELLDRLAHETDLDPDELRTLESARAMLVQPTAHAEPGP